MEKFLEITYLFDFYQELLTDKQRELVSSYYFDDLSLGELADVHHISRQSVFDAIKKSEQKLLDYEAKLSLWSKYQRQEKILTDLKQVICQSKQADAQISGMTIECIEVLIDQLISEM